MPEAWLRTGNVETILPRTELPPDDVELMHKVVLALEDMLDAHGWKLDLASKKLLARGYYEIALLQQQRPALTAEQIAQMAEAILGSPIGEALVTEKLESPTGRGKATKREEG